METATQADPRWETSLLTPDDGRRLEVSVTAGDGPVVLLHHGTPHSFLPATSAVTTAESLGLRLATFARAGYGSSSRMPGRSVADVAPDAAAVLDHLGVDAAYTAGTSGGGPHALACAALLPQRILAAASISGVAPYAAPGLDFLAGMGQDNIDEFGAALESEEALRAFLDPQVASMQTLDPDAFVEGMRSLLPPIDVACLAGGGAEIGLGLRQALGGGVDGWVDDDLAFTLPWGVDLGEVTVPVTLWQGGEDLMVPFAHGQALAGLLPDPVLHLLPDEGHLSILVGHFEAILRELVELGG